MASLHGHVPWQAQVWLRHWKELLNFLVGLPSVGYAGTRKQVIALVYNVVSRKGLMGVVTLGWWDSFRCRHPEITLRTAEHLTYFHAVASSVDTLDCYYDPLEQT